MLGLKQGQNKEMRRRDAVYAIKESRINIAGLKGTTISILARAIADVT